MANAKLVEEVKRLNPDASIEEILDKVRFITLQQILTDIHKIKFDTPIHIIEELCDRSLTLEDVITVLEWMSDFIPEMSDDIRNMIDSRSVSVVYNFCQTELSYLRNPPTCCMKFQCMRSKGRKAQQPSKT